MYLVGMFWVGLVFWVLVLAFSAALAFPSRRTLDRVRQQFAKRTGAYVDPSFVPAFDRDTRRAARLLAAAMPIALAIGQSIPEGLSTERPNMLLLIVPVVAVILVLFATFR